MGVALFAAATMTGRTGIAQAQTSNVVNWNGGYIGATAGGGWGRSTQTDSGIPVAVVPPVVVQPPAVVCPPPGVIVNGFCLIAADGKYGVRGGTIGGGGGYDWQHTDWVLGLAADYSASGIKGGSQVCGGDHYCGTSLESFGTVRGRVGHAFGATGAWLPYLTGGYAFGSVWANDAITPASGRNWRSGWTAGAGLETALSPGWSAKLEYLYMDLGTKVNFDVVPGIPESVSLTSNLVRIGLNYRFGR